MPPSVLDSLHFDPLVLWGAGLGLALGILLGWLVARVRTSAYASRLEERTQRVTDLEAERDQARTEGRALRDELATLRTREARLMAQADAERKAAEEKIGLLRTAEQHLREAFASLSAEALQRNSQSFLDLARASLGEFQ
jgi:DNA recombination protein RmuC